MSPDDVIRRGAAAARLLADETLMQCLAEIEGECTVAWVNSSPNDAAGREDAYRMIRCVALLRQRLETWRGAAHIEKTNAAWRLQEARGN